MSASVVVTGLGLVSPLGVGADATWARLLALEPALLEAPKGHADLAARPATAFAKDFPAEDYADPKAVRKASNLARMAAAAAVTCAGDAGLPEDAATREGAAVVIGTCFGSSDYYLRFHEKVRRSGLRAANAVLFTEGVFNAATGHACALLGLRGPGQAIVGGEESGLSAVAAGADRIRLGASAVLCGGAEEFSDLVQASLLSEGRVGTTLGGAWGPAPGPFAEGAAILCLEPGAVAEARGARAVARILGVARARSAGTGEPTADPGGLVRAARAALAEAGREVGDVDLLVGGAAGGPGGVRERAALADLLAGAGPVHYAAPKALLGEGFGFSSALLAAVGALALRRGVVPPTFVPPGGELPVCGPARAVGTPTEADLRTALVLCASAPGGAVAVVLGAA